MRFLLIHPNMPAYGGKETFRRFYPPLGLASIASPLLEAGHEVQILDVSIENLALPDVVNRAQAFVPDVVGVRCQFINYPHGLRIAEAIKNELPNCQMVFGGPHMGLVGKEAIKDHWYVDAVVHGEGEYTLLEYATALEQQGDMAIIPGLAWRNKFGEAIQNPPRAVAKSLDDFPVPAIDLLPMHLYRLMNFFTLEGHRGCPNQCIFCGLTNVQTRKVRYKSPERFVAEAERLVYQFGINRFEVIEPNFTILKRWSQEVCQLIIDRKLPIQWIVRSYPELVDQKTLDLLRAAGCYKIFYGIESGSAEILKRYGKVTKVQQGRDAIRMSKEAGLQVYCDVMVGGPGETPETVEETIRFIQETDPDYCDVSLIAPSPGTAMYDRAEEFGIRILDPKWYEKQEYVAQFPFVQVMELDGMPVRELTRLWMHAVTQIMNRKRTG